MIPTKKRIKPQSVLTFPVADYVCYSWPRQYAGSPGVGPRITKFRCCGRPHARRRLSQDVEQPCTWRFSSLGRMVTGVKSLPDQHLPDTAQNRPTGPTAAPLRPDAGGIGIARRSCGRPTGASLLSAALLAVGESLAELAPVARGTDRPHRESRP